MKTPVNSITIPPQYVAVASQYYGGMGDMLYAVCSTGSLTTGTNRPRFGDDGRRASDEEWYYSLWRDLVGCIDDARDCALFNAELADRNGEDDQEYRDDYDVLSSFAVYASRWADRLEAEYDICEEGVDHA